MSKGVIGALAITAVLVLCGGALAGGVWVTDSGEKHAIGHHAMFLDGEGTAFDLSELEDGETRTFGSGDEQLLASRDGDVVTLERPARGDEKALSITCELDTDSCRVMTFGDDSERLSVMITKTRGGHHGGIVTLDEEIITHGDGEATIVIEMIGDCAHEHGAEADCAAKVVKVLSGGEHEGHAVVEIISTDDDDATVHDLGEMLDGETRIFGYGEKQVTAVREGESVAISREATADDDAMSVTCKIGRDTCQVLTFEDDPEKVAIVIKQTRRCVNGQGDCDADLLHLEMGHGSGHEVKVIKLHGGEGDLIIEDGDGGKSSRRRVLIVSDDDD